MKLYNDGENLRKWLSGPKEIISPWQLLSMFIFGKWLGLLECICVLGTFEKCVERLLRVKCGYNISS